MSSWLENGRTAILGALAAACDEVDERTRAEIELRDRKITLLLEELEALKTRVAQVDSLQQDNKALQAEVGRLRETRDVQPISSVERTVLGELSPNKHAPIQPIASTEKSLPGTGTAREAPEPAKYKAVVAKCKELNTKYKEACKLLEDHRLKLRRRKQAIDVWASFSDVKQREIEKLEAMLKSRPFLTASVSTAQADDGVVHIASLKKPGQDTTFWHETPRVLPPVAISDGDTAIPSRRRSLSEPPPRLPKGDLFRPFGSGITPEASLPTIEVVDLPPYLDQTVEAPLAAVKVESSSDPPIIVSTRSARKRKHDGENSEARRFHSVKLEHSSSSEPEIIRESHHYSLAESIDFDEEVHVPTPRKRRALPQFRSEHVDTNSERTPGLRLILPGDVTLDASNASDTYAMESKLHRSPVHLAASSQMQQTGRSAMMMNKSDGSVYASPLALGIKDLAEDGDAEVETADLHKLLHPVVKGRLDALLNTPSANARPRINRVGSLGVRTPRPAPVEHNEFRARSSPVSLDVSGKPRIPRDTTKSIAKQSTRATLAPKPSVSREQAPKKPSILRDEMPRGRSVTKDDTPLRERPIERLRPEDFKPNPAYNDGLTFVYDEVVRGKEARAALSGCIDPKCCGKTFRHFAEAELESVGPSAMLRAEDVGLLERYLGDEAFKLGTMTREERKEVWLKAKTQELANKFGKHRHRYSRMPTPPGFWSVDFPNTQERAEELRQAEKIRNALVKERHREAMRCRGSWLFRDEDP